MNQALQPGPPLSVNTAMQLLQPPSSSLPLPLSASLLLLPAQARTPLLALFDVDMLVSQTLFSEMKQQDQVQQYVEVRGQRGGGGGGAGHCSGVRGLKGG